MADHRSLKHPFNFPRAGGTPPARPAARPDRPLKPSEQKAVAKNIALRVAAVTHTAEELDAAMARGQVKPEDFEEREEWEDDLEPVRRHHRR